MGKYMSVLGLKADGFVSLMIQEKIIYMMLKTFRYE